MVIPRILNPYPTNTPEWMDFCIWDAGIYHFNNAPYFKTGVPPPHELDYLHGFHNKVTLKEIQAFVGANLRANVRVTSVWLDKTQYVSPVDVSSSGRASPLLDRRELCDLAVIVRRNVNGKPERSMWLLQVKKLSSATAKLPTDDSTAKEVELLEECPPFELLKRKSCPAFNLSADFGVDPSRYRHWSFLAAYDYCPPYGGTTLPNALNPWQWRWLGNGVPCATGSFSDKLLQMCAGAAGVGNNFGVRIDEPDQYPEWHRLAVQLLRFGRRKRQTAAARGPHVLNISAYISAPISSSFVSIIDKEIGFDFPGGRPPVVARSMHTYPIKTTGFRLVKFANPEQIHEMSQEFVSAENAADFDYGHEDEMGGPPEPPDDSPFSGDGEGYEGAGVRCALIIDVVNEEV